MTKDEGFIHEITMKWADGGKLVMVYYINFLDGINDNVAIIETNGHFTDDGWAKAIMIGIDNADIILEIIATKWGLKYENESLIAKGTGEQSLLRLMQAIFQANNYVEFKRWG